jgi:hypothetical protein
MVSLKNVERGKTSGPFTPRLARNALDFALPRRLPYQNRTPEQIEAIKDQIDSRVPLGRTSELDEITAAALLLASDESRHSLGAELVVDCGILQI